MQAHRPAREAMYTTLPSNFNQLQSRQKQLQFARSPIHDWGLYALERIPKGDMVVEYIGEVIRLQIVEIMETTGVELEVLVCSRCHRGCKIG
jgi:SET domain-containing protein